MLEAQQWVGNGRYQLVRFLRAGGAGVVWEARDRRPRPGESAAVAIKVLDAAAGGAAAAEREAEGAARVQHPNVVRVRDTFTADGLAFMVMELAVGSLADLVAREGPLPPPIALGCALQACEALAAAHRAGVVHRDVKPHNLLVFADGSVRLADFGAARALMDGHTRTRTGALLGSIPFMAPEQRRDARAVQPATDVYALSVTLGWLLLGEAPEEPWTEEAAAQLRSVRAPEGLVHAFAAAGARRPEDRPADGAALLEVLRGCGVVPAPVPMPEGWEGVREDAPGGTVRAAAGRGSRWTLGVLGIAGVLGVAIVGVGAGWAGWGRGGDDEAVATTRSSESPVGRLERCTDYIDAWGDDVRSGPLESTGVAIQDVDEDGHPDVVIANQLSETDTIWWGVAGRMPQTQSEVFIGRHQEAPAIADIDGDGRNDIVAALQTDSAIAVAFATGPRTFAKPQRFPEDPAPVRLAVGDMDSDGRTDVLIRTVKGDVAMSRKGIDPPNTFAPHTLITRLGEDVLDWVPMATKATAYTELTASELRKVPVVGTKTVLAHGLNGMWKPKLLPRGTDGNWMVVTYLPDSHEHQLVRLTPTPCRIAMLPWDPVPLAVGDLDADGTLDVVTIHTCEGCTSNHAFHRGLRGAGAPRP